MAVSHPKHTKQSSTARLIDGLYSGGGGGQHMTLRKDELGGPYGTVPVCWWCGGGCLFVVSCGAEEVECCERGAGVAVMAVGAVLVLTKMGKMVPPFHKSVGVTREGGQR